MDEQNEKLIESCFADGKFCLEVRKNEDEAGVSLRLVKDLADL